MSFGGNSAPSLPFEASYGSRRVEIVDTSVELSHSLAELEFRDQAQRIMAALETQTALVPAIWCLELANGLLKKVRGKVVTKKEVDDTLARWSNLPMKTDTSSLLV